MENLSWDNTLYPTLRDQRQAEWANIWLAKKNGILYICPRGGKIKTSINILNSLNNPKTLIVYPINPIKDSWKNDFIKWKYDSKDVDYISTASLWKLVEHKLDYDLIILDEIHLLSPANIEEIKAILKENKISILGLSGTISNETENTLKYELDLNVLAYYSIEKAIEEGVITDYKITVVMTNLNNTVKYITPSKEYPNFRVTELDKYANLTKRIDMIKLGVMLHNKSISQNLIKGKYKDTTKELGLLPIQRMHIFKKSIAKYDATINLLNRARLHNQRVLVFCGTIEIADSLGIPVFHSKEKDLEVRDNFCNGIGNMLATVDMFEAGVTIKPINATIINSHDSNPENLAQRISRVTGLEYENPEKIAKIYIICTRDTIEEEWLKRALVFFDQSKINYINN